MAHSAGLLPFRRLPHLEVLIAHPGGPLWARRQEGAWSVVKGEVDPGEGPEAAARREFAEETGWDLPPGPYLPLGEVRQKGGKVVAVWAVEADFDPATLRPGTFLLEWPPRSGRKLEVPEIDQVAWCDLPTARRLLNPAQQVLVTRLEEALAAPPR